MEKVVITGLINTPSGIAIDNTFLGCSNLKEVWLPASYAEGRINGEYNDSAFSNINSATLRVYVELPDVWTEEEKTQALSKISRGSENWIWSDDTANWKEPD